MYLAAVRAQDSLDDMAFLRFQSRRDVLLALVAGGGLYWFLIKSKPPCTCRNCLLLCVFPALALAIVTLSLQKQQLMHHCACAPQMDATVCLYP